MKFLLSLASFSLLASSAVAAPMALPDNTNNALVQRSPEPLPPVWCVWVENEAGTGRKLSCTGPKGKPGYGTGDDDGGDGLNSGSTATEPAPLGGPGGANVVGTVP